MTKKFANRYFSPIFGLVRRRFAHFSPKRNRAVAAIAERGGYGLR